MADRTSASITVAAPLAEVMAVIADFPAYPQWASAVRSTEVISRDGAGRGTHGDAAGGALTGMLQEIMSAVEAALAASRAAGADGQDAAPDATVWADVTVRADVSGQDVTVQDVTVQEVRLQDARDEAGPAESPDGLWDEAGLAESADGLAAEP